MNGKQYLILILIILTGFGVSAQVQSVNYHLRYNSTTCLYEACIIITDGNAIAALDRLQFSAQFSIVVPTGSNVTLAQFYNPIQNNQNRTGTIPASWDLANIINHPLAMPDSDIYGITPSLSPSAFYNNLATGDTVRLFGVQISPITNCGEGIRLFANGVDPDSGAPGMNGGDFSNGFSIGDYEPKYASNSPSVNPKKPTVHSLTTSCANGLSIDLSASSNTCQTPLFYNWSGPDGYTATSQDINMPNAASFNSGLYAVTVSDNLGCTQTASIQAIAKPNAGPDQSISCFSSNTATLNAVGSGTWSLGANSAGTATIGSPSNAVSTVNNFSAAGNYYLIWSSNGCADTSVIIAGNNCACSIVNNLTLPNVNTFCGGSPSVTLDGNTIAGTTGTYQWIYKINNGNFINATGTSTNEDYETGALSPGVYSFRRVFNKTTAPACIDTSNLILITVIQTPNAGADKVVNCLADGTTTLVSTTPGLWSLGDGSAGVASFSSVSGMTTTLSGFSAHGVYNIVRSSASCKDTAIVSVNDLCGCDYANAGSDTNKCAGDNLILNGHCSIGVWSSLSSNPAGATLSPSVNGNAQVQWNDQAVGVFKFVYTTLEENRDTVSFTVNPKPVVSLGEDFGFCEGGESVLVTANGGVSYLWSTGQTTSSILIAPMTSTSYTVTATDSNGCKNADALNVTIFPKPQGQIPYIAPVFENDNLSIAAGSWTHASQYIWQGPNGFLSNNPNNNLTNVTTAESGMYYLTVVSPDDCENIDAVMVTVMERVLPVKLSKFSGSYIKYLNANELLWQTYSELNSDYFIVERSDDNGKTFSGIANIKGAGNSNTINEYFFVDQDIQSGKTYFYRLVQVDYNETKTLSEIIAIKTDNAKLVQVSFYPNPTIDKLYINIDKPYDDPIAIDIYNVNGVLVYQNYIYPNSQSRIALDGFDGSLLPQGVYFAKTRVEGVEFQYKLMIVK